MVPFLMIFLGDFLMTIYTKQNNKQSECRLLVYKYKGIMER